MKENLENSFLELFGNQAASTPHQIAVVFNEETLTYQKLDERSNQFANYLVSLGIGKGTLVGIYLERSPEMLVSILGILKAGAAYIPLDPMYPQDRLSFMLEDTEAPFLVTTSTSDERFDITSTRIFTDKIQDLIDGQDKIRPEIAISGNDLAYIIYTSGSTGKPKGAQIEHRGLLNFLKGMLVTPGIARQDVVLALSTISFDVSKLELFVPLIVGAKIVLADSEARRDGDRILQLLKTTGVTVLQGTPVTWRMVIEAGWDTKLPIKALCGGESFPQDLANQLLDLCNEVWNLYGPTETTVWAMAKKVEKTTSPISIGRPISGVFTYILNEQRQPVKDGEIGEIYIGGAGVGRGYINRPELNTEVFVPDPHTNANGGVMYKTGDLGQLLENGEIFCLGRIDHQVKIRGYRVELGEIENAISQFPNIKKNCVHYWDQQYAGRRLVGYLISEDGETINLSELMGFLRQRLPDYMVPTAYVPMNTFPLTESGKINRKLLPVPVGKRPEMAVLYKSPKTPVETYITGIWAALLEIDRVGVDDNFFDLGGNSLLATKTVALLREKHGLILPIYKLYQHITASNIARDIEGKENQQKPSFVSKQRTNNNDIAIIGMAGRFPGANSIEELWSVLIAGKETIRFFKPEELDADIPEDEREHPNYVKARGVIKDVEWFDAELFGLTPLVSTFMDPQHRIFLEICREALEKSGHFGPHYTGKIGVYSGCDTNSYYIRNLLSNPAEIDKIGSAHATYLNEKDYLSNRVAFHLNLTGPTVSVYSACSTSLLAVAEAAKAIRAGQCEAALAGGISITVPTSSGHIYQEGAMFNDDGHCRPFDAKGKGTVFSDGGGVVLLKDFEAAKRDGDKIFAILKGIGVTNDGRTRSSFTAPSPKGQAAAITSALADAAVSAEDIGYVEAHGTATPIGDPIEIEGLKLAFGEQQKQYCRIGSIKGNIGHLVHGAGVAGLIKATLALHYKKIPASINYSTPNPNIDFENSPFIVNDTLHDWHSNSLRRAGVSSFGVGGTNVHVILEEYETNMPINGNDSIDNDTIDNVLINWSAKSEKSISMYADHLKHFIHNNPNVSLQDIAFTLQKTRQDYHIRSFIIASSTDHLVEQLETKAWSTSTLNEDNNNVVFMFPGQGAQYAGMGSHLYQREIVYREAVDECAAILERELGEDIREILYGEGSEGQAQEKLQNTYYTQPALFTAEYALAKLWMSWGIMPTAFIGHSVGEFVAAHLSGVFSLADALKLITSRGRLISRLPAGSMLAIRASADEIKDNLSANLSIAAVNAPKLCVVSGEGEHIQKYADQLNNLGIKTSLLHTSHAFHSAMMNPILDEFEKVAGTVSLHVPKKPIVSTVTGEWIQDNEAINPRYWANHVKAPVLFSQALQFVEDELKPIFLEVGPGNVTSTLARQHGAAVAARTVSSAQSTKGLNEYRAILEALGRLWQLNILPQWKALYNTSRTKLSELPTYAYNKKYYWINPKPRAIIPSIAANNDYTNLTPVPDIEQRPHTNHTVLRKETLISKIKQLLEHASGIEFEGVANQVNFIEIGLDSLLLTQIAQNLKKEFQLPITFRKLSEEYYNLDLLAEYLDKNLPATTTDFPSAALPTAPLEQPVYQMAAMPMTGSLVLPQANDDINLIYQQISLLSQQINLLSQQAALLQGALKSTPQANNPPHVNGAHHEEVSPQETTELKKPFEAKDQPPVPDAKLGKDRQGNPAWFVEDKNNPGKYLQVVI